MRFENIEVNGITEVVINRSIYTTDGDRWYQFRQGLTKPIPSISHDTMVKRVHALKNNPNARVWISGNTINIVIEKPVKNPDQGKTAFELVEEKRTESEAAQIKQIKEAYYESRSR